MTRETKLNCLFAQRNACKYAIGTSMSRWVEFKGASWDTRRRIDVSTTLLYSATNWNIISRLEVGGYWRGKATKLNINGGIGAAMLIRINFSWNFTPHFCAYNFNLVFCFVLFIYLFNNRTHILSHSLA